MADTTTTSKRKKVTQKQQNNKDKSNTITPTYTPYTQTRKKNPRLVNIYVDIIYVCTYVCTEIYMCEATVLSTW